jgi:hypothetical protein
MHASLRRKTKDWGAVVAVITDALGSNLDQGEMHNIL